MYRVVYVSAASQPLSSAQLSQLASRWQERNAAVGITGICLYIGGNFMQAFEGTDAVARQLFQRIKVDKLHRNVTTLLSEEAIAERVFGDWSLDFREAADIPNPQLTRLRSFIDETLAGPVSGGGPVAVELLAAFVRMMHPHASSQQRRSFADEAPRRLEHHVDARMESETAAQRLG